MRLLITITCTCSLLACEPANDDKISKNDENGNKDGTLPKNAGQAGMSTDLREATNPALTATPPISLQTDKEVEDALEAASTEINAYRNKGIGMFIAQLKQDLIARGKSTTAIEGFGDDDVGKPMPAAVDSKGDPVKPAQGTPPPGYATYFSCPLLAPDTSSSDDCEKLIEGTTTTVQKQIEAAEPQVAKDVAAQHAQMSAEARAFVISWAVAALRYGANVASIYAVQKLRAAGQCDTNPSKMRVAHLLGVEQGQTIVLGHYPWAQAQAATCVVNTDTIAAQVKIKAETDIPAFMAEHKPCTEEDFSFTNTVYVAAEA